MAGDPSVFNVTFGPGRVRRIDCELADVHEDPPCVVAGFLEDPVFFTIRPELALDEKLRLRTLAKRSEQIS
jgi:hypothetical protein